MPTQSTNVSGGQFGIKFGGQGLTWTVQAGVSVHGTAAGVFSDFANSTLINSGAISSTSGPEQIGVWFSLDDTSGTYLIENRPGGSITGRDGVTVNNLAGSLKVINDGSMGGGNYAIRVDGSTAVTIENSGNLSGAAVAVNIFTDELGSAGPSIDNRGMISGEQYGIDIYGSTGTTARIINQKGGVIESDFVAVRSREAMSFDNAGQVTGHVVGSSPNDKVVNTGKIDGGVFLYLGNDTFQNKGKGSSGLIDSGGGDDRITLGDKNDKLLFDSALNAGTNVDKIKNFKSGKDKIYLDDDFFVGLRSGKLSSSAFQAGKKADDPKDRVIYDKKSGGLSFDSDGKGGTAQVQFATLDKNTKLKASDFVAGEYSLFA